ncbi:MAG: metallophosphoesterase [Candidatus Ochrobactrum gambitense]|nr:MAG: metallophosphoesterase [Candidatus Ochrobactrum gambitense]WEK16996.1 MAG: metallophosphoesterase [Candidatus Ochrobactrum gambitense]
MKAGCVTFLASLALALPALVPATTGAQAQVRKDVSEYAGRRCSAPPRGSGIIFGQFSGVDDSPMVSMDGIVPVDRVRCFTSVSECKGWLYTMQSKYTNAGPATVARCTKR